MSLYTFSMGRRPSTKRLLETLERARERIRRDNIKFAKQLHELQKKQFPARLRTIHDWAVAEKLKRLMLEMPTEKTELEVSGSGTLRVDLSDFSDEELRIIEKLGVKIAGSNDSED